jgi:predicted transposase/invertase (TIGR01784 family)
MKAKYINPYTDFGFKKLFGEEASKELLIDFLNELLPAKHKIKTLTFNNSEVFGDSAEDRKSIFDIYCQNEREERFIVEMQKARQSFFKDRSLYYATFPIRDQAEKGGWNYRLNPVYFIALMDFEFEDMERITKHYRTDVELKDQDNLVFNDNIKFIYLEMERFNKTLDQLETRHEKWMYFLKHLEDFDILPEILKEPVFEKSLKIAEIAGYDEKERDRYEGSLRVYRDMKNAIDTSYDDGIAYGMSIGKSEIAKMMKMKGISHKDISEITGLSINELKGL